MSDLCITLLLMQQRQQAEMSELSLCCQDIKCAQSTLADDGNTSVTPKGGGFLPGFPSFQSWAGLVEQFLGGQCGVL